MDKTFSKILIIMLVAIGVLVGALSIIGIGCYFAYKPIMAKINYENGLKYKEYGWPIKSKEAMEEVIKLAPDSDTAEKAKIFIDTRLPKAVDLSGEAVTLNVKGYRFNKNGKYEDAIKMFKAALEISPDFEWPYSNMAMIYYYQDEDYDQAKKFLEKAIEINPHYTNARMNLAYISFTKARKELDEKNYKVALNLFNESLDSCMVVKKADPYYESVNSKIEDINKYLSYTKQQMSKSTKDKLE